MIIKMGTFYIVTGAVIIGASVHGTARLAFGIATAVFGYVVNVLSD